MPPSDESPAKLPRRGWSEPIEPGIRREHRTACESSRDRRPGRRCRCPFLIRVPGPGGTGSSGGARTVHGSLSDARRIRAQAIAEGRTVRAVPVAVETLHDFSISWFRARAPVLADATLFGYEHAYRRRIAPHLGGLRLDELTRERLEVWLATLLEAEPERRRSIEQAVGALSTMLTAAVDWGRLPYNPALRLRLPKAPPREKPAERVLTPAERDRLVEAAGSRLRPDKALRNRTLVRTAAEVGLRTGELLALRWPNVRLGERRVVVAENVRQRRGGERLVQTPKGGRAHRAAITPQLAAELSAWFQLSVVEGGADAHGLVWPGPDGRALARTTWRRLLDRAVKRAGIAPPAEHVAATTPHRLRHTAASIALSQGVGLVEVSRQLGHADPNITGRVYAHLLSDSHLDAFAAAQDRSRAGGEAGGEQPEQAENPA
jgi:integrase